MYTFKASPYSSHSLLLRALPRDGYGRRVLDVGCGNGYLGSILTGRGFEVTGIERRGGYREPFPEGVRLIEADLEDGLPQLPLGTFDFILCADILEHLRDPGRLLKELYSLAHPEGVLVASLPNSGNLYFRLNILAGRFPQEDKGLFDRTHLRFFMWTGWKTLLQESGWKIVDFDSSAIPIGLVTPPQWEHSDAVRTAERICYALAKLRKTLFAYQFVVTACPINKKS